MGKKHKKSPEKLIIRWLLAIAALISAIAQLIEALHK